jgi:branched-subunit amino acid aminotransferase/4-amino-4-deoxychorismate lyase
VVIEIAQQNQLPFQIGNYELADIQQADELFITNSLIGVCSVRQLQDQAFSFGPITKMLIEKLDVFRQQKGENEAA